MIRQARPAQLFIAADGPRPGRNGEYERCIEVRKIAEAVDWQCEVHTNYSAENLGCRKKVSTSIDWFFENVEEGIILEDDCLPDLGFFRFCDEVLPKYRNQNNVSMVSGTNYLPTWNASGKSYFYSYWGGIWGRASSVSAPQWLMKALVPG